MVDMGLHRMTAPRDPVRPTVQVDSPEEHLDGAEELVALQNPKMRRAGILEAVTALEAFGGATEFSSLENRLDLLLVELLKGKMRMDFDSHLSLLTAVATG